MKIFCDAGTRNNGQRGHQKTTIALCDEVGEILFENYIGDYTNNEGEILAITAALKIPFSGLHKDIYSDSHIAVNWVIKGWSPKYQKKHKEKVGEEIHSKLFTAIKNARELYKKSGATLQWIPREENIAGWYLERKYNI